MIDLTPDQQSLAALARRVLGDLFPPEAVRRLRDDADLREHVRATLTATGLHALIIPEEHGGQGMGFVELAVVLEEAGAVAAPLPLIELAAVAAVLRRHEVPGCAELLAGLTDGRTRLTSQLAPHAPILDAGDADHVLAFAAPDRLVLAPRDQLALTPTSSHDPARAIWLLTRVDGGDLLPPDVVAHHDAVVRTAVAAVMVGLGRGMVDLAVTHARAREQFGRPIGSFQAVKHRLATPRVRLEAAQAAVWTAAAALDRDEPFAATAAMVAHLAATIAADEASDAALQVHGGIGFTWEHDLHLWMKRVLALTGSGPAVATSVGHLAAAAIGGTPGDEDVAVGAT